MPTQLQWLRARAIHACFKGCAGIDSHIHQRVFAFCDCPPTIFAHDSGYAFALLTDWNSVVTWGHEEYGGDSRDVAAQLSADVHSVFGNVLAFAAVKVDGSVVTSGAALAIMVTFATPATCAFAVLPPERSVARLPTTINTA